MSILFSCGSVLIHVGICFLIVMPPANAGLRSQSGIPNSSPTEALRSAQSIFIHTKSVYFKPATLENALLKKDEFQQWGLIITREKADADLIIEVDRKLFTTSFVYSVIDPRNKRVLASGRVNSIGGTVEGKISDSFIKRLRQVRSPPSSNQAK